MVKVDMVKEATERLARAFDTVGRVGTVILESNLWGGIAFADASGRPRDVIDKLAYENWTTPEYIAFEILSCPIYNAAECEALNA